MTTIIDEHSPETAQADLFGDEVRGDSPVSLTPLAYDLALELDQLGAREAAVELPHSIDRSPLTELRRKGVIKIIGGTRGHPGRVSLIIARDRLVLSQRRRNERSGAPPAAVQAKPLVRPTIEDLRTLVTTVEEFERETYAQRSAEIEETIASLKLELVDAKTGSPEEQDLFERLSAQMQRLRSLEAEIRVDALKRIEDAGGPLAAFVGIISPERSPQPPS